MLMSPDSSSADPDPISPSCLSSPAMIQVPECTQSHGGSIAKPMHIVDYNKKLEPADFGPKLHQVPIFHQKSAMVPKSDEDLNLGNVRLHPLIRNRVNYGGVGSVRAFITVVDLIFVFSLRRPLTLKSESNAASLVLVEPKRKKFHLRWCLCALLTPEQGTRKAFLLRGRATAFFRSSAVSFGEASDESQCQWNFLDC